MINNLALNLKPEVSDTDFSNVYVGKNRFTDDTWDFFEYIDSKTTANTFKKIKFGYIQNESIKNVVKQFTYYKLGKVTVKTLAHYVYSLSSFIDFCKRTGIKTLKELNVGMINDYVRYIRFEKRYKESTVYRIVSVISEIVRVGQIEGWEVTSDTFFSYHTIQELVLSKRTFKDEKRTQPIPKDIFDKILYYAVHKENRVLTKAGIIIQSQTGLRINEVLGIKNGCLSTTAEGHTFLEVSISKTEKGEPIKHKVYANELVCSAILQLTQYTEPLRERSGLQELFLVNARGIITNSKPHAWTRKRLRGFIKRWDIRDSDGNLYPLKSHQFRATFVRELIKQNVPINHIMKQFSHLSMDMTMHYLTLQENEVREIYADMILQPNAKIAGMRAKEIKDLLNDEFRGKTAAEIDSVIADLSETMSFNPLPNGICLYDFRRGNCTNGDGCFFYNCPNYITEAKFYPILKRELDLIETEMRRLKKLGHERDWQRQYIKYEHLKNLVVSLEEQIDE